MSEGTSQPANQPTRARAVQDTRRMSSKRAQQAATASPPAQEVAAPLAAPETTGSAASQVLPAAEAPAEPAPDAPPIGERWGEFPSKERRVKLARILHEWEQVQDHGEQPAPFAKKTLTGADLFWLAVFRVRAEPGGALKKSLQKLLIPSPLST